MRRTGQEGTRCHNRPPRRSRGSAQPAPFTVSPAYSARGTLGWQGGLSYELGHAFGLKHPLGCAEGMPETSHASRASNFVTGASIPVDGGYLVQ